MGKRKKGVRRGFEAQGRYAPPERNGLGTYGTHRTAGMEDARAARLAKVRDISEVPCSKFIETGLVFVRPCAVCDSTDHPTDECPHGTGLEEPCVRGTIGCSADHRFGRGPCREY